MQKTIFLIAKMDCPSEEQLVRMKLGDLPDIRSLDFDIPNRKLTLYHSGSYDPVLTKLEELKLSTSLIETVTVTDDPGISDDQSRQKRLLWRVLLINLFFFLLEILAGFLANSMGLVADSLDMLADSLVYGLALYAVGGTIARKNNIARASGYFQLTLAVFGLAEVIRRFIGVGPVPSFQIMILISVLALIGNSICLFLLQKGKSKEAHMQASMIFTSNDVIVNLGVILAGILVYLTHSKYPDLVIGIIVFGLVGRGAVRILKLAGKNPVSVPTPAVPPAKKQKSQAL